MTSVRGPRTPGPVLRLGVELYFPTGGSGSTDVHLLRVGTQGFLDCGRGVSPGTESEPDHVGVVVGHSLLTTRLALFYR